MKRETFANEQWEQEKEFKLGKGKLKYQWPIFVFHG